MQQSNSILQGKILEATLAQLYELEKPITCSFLRRSFNDHYLVSTGKEQFILRVYLNDKNYIHSVEEIHFELDFLTYLHSRSVAVIAPISSKKNQKLSSITFEDETRYLTLFPFAKGKAIESELTKEQAVGLGEMIGELHRESKQFESGFSRYRLDGKSLMEDPLNEIEKYTCLFGLGNLHFFRETSRILMEGIEHLPKDDQTYGLVHGDPNPSNFHFCKINGFSLFDFDHCGYGYRIHDLAVVKLSYPVEIYQSVVEGYEGIRTLKGSEKVFIDNYADILSVKKFSDIFNMLEVTGADEATKKLIAQNAMETLGDILNRTP